MQGDWNKDRAILGGQDRASARISAYHRWKSKNFIISVPSQTKTATTVTSWHNMLSIKTTSSPPARAPHIWVVFLCSSHHFSFNHSYLLCWQFLTLSWEQLVEQENIRDPAWASSSCIPRMKVKGGSTSRSMMGGPITTCTGEIFLESNSKTWKKKKTKEKDTVVLFVWEFD